MRPVLYTQRVDVVESYNERRDCADQNIPKLLQFCGYLPIPVPNVLNNLDILVESIRPAGIMLTGGNSLVKYTGFAPERDRTDLELIQLAIERKIPVYGFCRGMQSILDYFGCKLENVKGHVAVRHVVYGEWGNFVVNSYHNQACLNLIGPLQATALSEDGIIEAVVCKEIKIMATMWHPERENPFWDEDVQRIKKLFG